MVRASYILTMFFLAIAVLFGLIALGCFAYALWLIASALWF